MFEYSWVQLQFEFKGSPPHGLRFIVVLII
jgi:hypothetical protein